MTEKEKYEIYYSSRKSFHFSNCIVGTLLSIWQTLEIASIYSTQQEKPIQLLRNSILKVCLRNLLDLNLITRWNAMKINFIFSAVESRREKDIQTRFLVGIVKQTGFPDITWKLVNDEVTHGVPSEVFFIYHFTLYHHS